MIKVKKVMAMIDKYFLYAKVILGLALIIYIVYLGQSSYSYVKDIENEIAIRDEFVAERTGEVSCLSKDLEEEKRKIEHEMHKLSLQVYDPDSNTTNATDWVW